MGPQDNRMMINHKVNRISINECSKYGQGNMK